ncbi:MAG: NB-ARC domain-containing protein [Cyanobacteria bacterium J06597_1]
MPYRAFLSSTYEDLKEHRKYVIAELRKAGVDVVAMEDWTAAPEEPKALSVERLVGCDLCVLLVGFRRGYVPDGETKSITQLEYEAAIERGLDILVFLLDEDAEWRRRFDELDKDPEIRKWRDLLQRKLTVGWFDREPSTIDISSAWSRWVQEKDKKASHSRSGSRIGIPFQAPPLPRHFVQRPKELERLKSDLLIAEIQTGTLVMSAIHGLGGIGKSTLAADLARDADVQEFFVDGILWATLGQQPDVLSLLSGWIQALGDRDFKPTTAEVASSHLRTLLRGKSMLLVVDDAWNADHVSPFQVGSDRTRVLVTTREAQVAGAEYVRLQELTREQSIDLLRKSAGAFISGQEELTAELAHIVGDLPLALELASVQLGEGVIVEDLIEDLKHERLELERFDADFARDESTRKKCSLAASFNLSLKRLRVEQLHQFAWMGVLPEDVPITAKMAATLWQMNEGRAARALLQLRAKALLLPLAEGVDRRPTFRLHDLMHDAAQKLLQQNGKVDGGLPGLGLTVQEAHAQLLKRYRAIAPDRQWCQLPDDGYIHGYLTWHMEQAGWDEALHKLLAETTEEGRNGWYETCDRLGQLSYFVRDVARGWERAKCLLGSDPSESVVLQLRYATIVTSLNSMAINIPAELIAALVEKDYWSPVQGLAYAFQAQEESKRVEALRALCKHLPTELMGEVLESTRKIPSESFRANALRTLCKHLPMELTGEALEVTRGFQSEPLRADALRALYKYLPTELMGEALGVARGIQNASFRANALGALSKRQPELLDEALKTAIGIQDEFDRALKLIDLSEHHKELLGEALEAACRIQSESSRSGALRVLFKHLPVELVEKALESTRSIQDEYFRALALCTFVEHQPGLIGEAVETARRIKVPAFRAAIFSSLAKFLQPESMEEVLEAIRCLFGTYRVEILAELSEQQPELMREALETALRFQNELHRADALKALSGHLSPELMQKALEAARQIQDPSSRALALSALSKYQPELMKEALNAARSIQDWSSLASALRELSEHHQELTDDALNVAREIPSGPNHASALIALSKHHQELTGEALDAVCNIQSEAERASALAELSKHLPPKLMKKALGAACKIRSESDRASALTNLCRYLSQELMGEALDAVQEIQSEFPRASALIVLSERQPELTSEALDTIRKIQAEPERASALEKLCKHLPVELMEKALDVVHGIQSKFFRTSALIALSKHQPELLGEALKVAREIQEQSSLSLALGALSKDLPELLSETLEAVREIQEQSARASVLRDLSVHHQELTKEALKTIGEIQEQATRTSLLIILYEHLPSELMKEALAATNRIRFGPHRATALRCLTEHLPTDLMAEALEAAHGIQDESSRADVLNTLFKYLPKELWERNKRVHGLKDPYCRAKASIGLIQNPYFEKSSLLQWSQTLGIISYLNRKDFISEFPYLVKPIRHHIDNKIVISSVHSVLEICKQWP